MSEVEGPWWSVMLECPVCGHEQASVFPDQTQKLECGGCGHMMDRPEETQPWGKVAYER